MAAYDMQHAMKWLCIDAAQMAEDHALERFFLMSLASLVCMHDVPIQLSILTYALKHHMTSLNKCGQHKHEHVDNEIGALQQACTCRCFEDRCPHRLAPLSEGRIEPSDGTLFCNYHGWRYDGSGACRGIPQLDPAQSHVMSSPR